MEPNPAPADARAAIQAALQLAVQRHQAGDLKAAESLYGQVLLADPQQGIALHNLGQLLQERGDCQDALSLLTAAVELHPREANFHVTLGATRQKLQDLPGAIACYQRAVELRPQYLEAWENLGLALHLHEQFDRAEAAYRKALSLDRSSKVRLDYGHLLRDVGRPAEAEALYREVLERHPLDTGMAIQHGLTRLSRGDFSGWNELEWSHWSADWLKMDRPWMVPLPRWDGESLEGRSILLYGEQGIGDEIMFASPVPEVARAARRTVLMCEPRLAPLFARSFPDVVVTPRPAGGQPAIDAQLSCDLRLSLSRLPGVLRRSPESFTGEPYLRADPAAAAAWRTRLAALGGRMVVGISWRGGANDRTRVQRSLDLALFAPLFAHQQVRFVDLQYGDHAAEITAFNAVAPQPLVHFDDVDPLRDMDGFAALLSALDLVISVDNSTVHLAGALDVPTWMLTPANPNWRWPHEGEHSRWYRSVRLFRQPGPRHADWPAAIESISTALHEAAPREPAAADETRPVQWIPAPAPSTLLVNDPSYWQDWGRNLAGLALHSGLRATGRIIEPLPPLATAALAPLPTVAAHLDDQRLFAAFAERNGKLLQRIERSGEIIICGAGEPALFDRHARALLWLAWVAKVRYGKRTSLLNYALPALAGRDDGGAAAAFCQRICRELDFIAVRDPASAATLRELGVDAVQAFDTLPLFLEQHRPAVIPGSARRIVFAGLGEPTSQLVEALVTLAGFAQGRGHAPQLLVGANAFIAEDEVRLASALHARLHGRHELRAATSERQWIEALAGASLLVTGRRLHAVAAAAQGTPVMTLGGEPGLDALMDQLGLPAAALRIDAANARQGKQQVEALLKTPSTGVASAETLRHLTDLASRGFPPRP